MRERIRAFGYALQGISSLFREPHFRFHILAFVAVVSLGAHFDIAQQEWTVILLISALVLGLEAMNSGLENLADALHPDRHPLIKKSKDMAAGAVLIASIFAVVIGLIIFLPYFKKFLE